MSSLLGAWFQIYCETFNRPVAPKLSAQIFCVESIRYYKNDLDLSPSLESSPVSVLIRDGGPYIIIIRPTLGIHSVRGLPKVKLWLKVVPHGYAQLTHTRFRSTLVRCWSTTWGAECLSIWFLHVYKKKSHKGREEMWLFEMKTRLKSFGVNPDVRNAWMTTMSGKSGRRFEWRRKI